MVDHSDTPQDELQAVTTEVCATWDIDVHDPEDIRITEADDEYEALVPISGRVLLDDLLDTQGRLLGIKNSIAVELDGFQDDRLLLTLDPD